ncbi:MAG: NAD-dependent epimerase/dehydratase family protein [Eubacteriales bacterium]|nr:NAD-dependent epimerase/dehydratase family protein [Eubacteriales bacterium]
MNILITGARGFMGKNLRSALTGRCGDAHRLMLLDMPHTEEELLAAAAEADFVFHLAGVNRPTDPADFQKGNADFTRQLLTLLKERGKRPPVLLSSSIQAALENPYGQSKLSAEQAVADYGRETGSAVYLYRLPNVFGKWSRPNYNSAVATFCHNVARGLPITVNDPSVTLRLVYIDDVVEEFLRAMEGQPHREGEWCTVQPVHEVNLGHMAELIQSFPALRDSLTAPDQSDPLVKKLYATYLSFLPPEDFSRPTVTHADQRGSFTELLHMGSRGQVSLNVSRPHITKGDHWHQTKHEKFIVLQGEGVIRFRKVGDSTVIAYKVSGENLTVVDIPTGYTHSIENTGDTDMLTLMWANEVFDPAHPDTLRLPVLETPAEAKEND